MTVSDNASELYNEYLDIYFDQYMALSDGLRTLSSKYDLTILFLETNNNDVWFENKASNGSTKSGEESTGLPPKAAIEEDEEEVKQEKELKILNSNKLLISIVSTNKSWK